MKFKSILILLSCAFLASDTAYGMDDNLAERDQLATQAISGLQNILQEDLKSFPQKINILVQATQISDAYEKTKNKYLQQSRELEASDFPGKELLLEKIKNQIEKADEQNQANRKIILELTQKLEASLIENEKGTIALQNLINSRTSFNAAQKLSEETPKEK